MTRTAHPRIAEGLEDACWEGYEAVGMKEKDGKQVPNCVPTKTAAGFPAYDSSHQETMLSRVRDLGKASRMRDMAIKAVEGAVRLLKDSDNRDAKHLVEKAESDLRRIKGTAHPSFDQVVADTSILNGHFSDMKWQFNRKTAAHRLDGVRGHQLLPSTLARKLPPIYSQEDVEDPLVQVKLFSPYSGAVWYLTEYDPASRDAFGWADLGMGGGELGYISVSELEGLNRGGLPLVERDLYWKPVPLSKAKGGRMASSEYPSVVREVEDDYKRKAITRGEREELLSAISGASSKQEAERIVSEHRKGRAASVRVAARYIANRIP